MSDISASSKFGEQIISEAGVDVVKYLYIFVLHLQLQQK